MRFPISRRGAELAGTVAEGSASALLFSAAIWFPPFGLLLCLMSPLPLAVSAWRRGPLKATAALLVAVGLTAAANGPTGAAMYFAQFGLGGFLLGLAARQGRSPEGVVGVYAAAAVLGFWALLGVVAVRSGVTPAALLGDTLKQAADQA
ncbi:MAG: DUF2232 domain-containing protein, partial [Deltaproteobacteria bacterium]|nr:DUF2232 domain-containing protein [Deltaproteobacteria bacterium]